MKSFTITLAASLAAGVSASAHGHNHGHLHAKKAAHKVEARAPEVVTKYVPGPVETAYVLAGHALDAKKAQEGIDNGDYVVIGETTPTFVPPPPPPKPTTSADQGAKFFEKQKPSSAAPPPPPPSPSVKAAPAAQAAQAASSSSSSGTTGSGSDFPSGQIDCNNFPSNYGAVRTDWMGLEGWAGVQNTPDFTMGVAGAISKIITGIAGSGGCTKGSFCQYACAPGYQMAQWPTNNQGNTGQSIGGVYCNSQGKLELTRSGSNVLCEKGAGGISIKNTLSEKVSLCRTLYPGTEAMIIPTVAEPGATVEVTNPIQSKYYQWQGKMTSAQYYLNLKGYGPDQACVWNAPANPTALGNWAAVIIGVGKADDGVTYLSIFPNAPTSTAQLDFNVKITGDVSMECSLINGVYSGGSNGCTVSFLAHIFTVASDLITNTHADWCSQRWQRCHHLLLNLGTIIVGLSNFLWFSKPCLFFGSFSRISLAWETERGPLAVSKWLSRPIARHWTKAALLLASWRSSRL